MCWCVGVGVGEVPVSNRIVLHYTLLISRIYLFIKLFNLWHLY